MFILPTLSRKELAAKFAGNLAAKMKLHMSCYLHTAVHRDFYHDGLIRIRWELCHVIIIFFKSKYFCYIFFIILQMTYM